MKTRSHFSHCAFLSVCILSLATLLTSFNARADELVSLDDPAPIASTTPAPYPSPAGKPDSLSVTKPAAADSLESLDGSAAIGGGEVALDLGSEKDSFNPYLFSRNTLWGLLPLFSLILLGLHLLPVPKRKIVNKIDQAQRFFRVNDQDKTGMIQRPTAAQLAGAASEPNVPKSGILNVDEKTPPPGEAKTRVFIPPGGGKVFVPQGEED